MRSKLQSFPIATTQQDNYTCGVHASLAVARHFRLGLTFDVIMKGVGTTRYGTGGNNVVRFFRAVDCPVVKYPRMTMTELQEELRGGRPVIVKIRNRRHFQVVWGVTQHFVWVADSVDRRRKVQRADFMSDWDRWGAAVGSPRSK